MIAIITGDIIGSETTPPGTWMPLLKTFLGRQGTTPRDWEIYRGDAFQLKLTTEEALYKSILLRSIIKQHPGLDVRVSIGIGAINYHTKK